MFAPNGVSPAWEGSYSPRAFFQTFAEVLFCPASTFRTMSAKASLDRSLFFYLIPLILYATFVSFTLPHQMEEATEQIRQMNAPSEYIEIYERIGNISTPIRLAGILLMLIVSLLVQSLVFHLFLMLFGGAKQGFESTFRVLSYSFGATTLFNIVPCAGWLIALIWQAICTIVGLSEQNGISRGRATVVVMAPGILFILCCAFGFMIMFLKFAR